MYVSALKNYGRSALSFYFTKIFHMDIAFLHYISPHFAAYLTIFSLKFTLKCLELGQKPR